jgi:hypothetical protein
MLKTKNFKLLLTFLANYGKIILEGTDTAGISGS